MEMTTVVAFLVGMVVGGIAVGGLLAHVGGATSSKRAASYNVTSLYWAFRKKGIGESPKK